MIGYSFILVALSALGGTYALATDLQQRSGLNLPIGEFVLVQNVTSFCLILPSHDISIAESKKVPFATQAYCTPQGKASNPEAALFPPGFIGPDRIEVSHRPGNGENGGNITQVTASINPSKSDHLNPSDEGGSYYSTGPGATDSSPFGSVCMGYNAYLQITEPSKQRVCLRCCSDEVDCKPQEGVSCTTAIKGNYFNTTA